MRRAFACRIVKYSISDHFILWGASPPYWNEQKTGWAIRSPNQASLPPSFFREVCPQKEEGKEQSNEDNIEAKDYEFYCFERCEEKDHSSKA